MSTTWAVGTKAGTASSSAGWRKGRILSNAMLSLDHVSAIGFAGRKTWGAAAGLGKVDVLEDGKVVLREAGVLEDNVVVIFSVGLGSPDFVRGEGSWLSPCRGSRTAGIYERGGHLHGTSLGKNLKQLERCTKLSCSPVWPSFLSVEIHQ